MAVPLSSPTLGPRPHRRTGPSISTAAIAVALLLASGLLAGCDRPTASDGGPLETAAAVAALPAAEAATGRPVRLTGRVTFFDGEWRLLALEDATGTVLVDPGDDGYLTEEGTDLVLQGKTAVREGQALVASPVIETRGRHPRAVGPLTTLPAVVGGRHDGRRVEIRGVLEEAKMAQGRWRGILRADGQPLIVWVRSGSVSDAVGLVGQAVGVRGVPLRATAAARQRRESELFVDTLADLLLVHPPAVASTVITDAASIRRLSNFDSALRHRVRLRGVVTYVDPAWRLVFVQDDTAGVYVNTQNGPPVAAVVGDDVEIQGVTDTGGFAPSVIAETVQVRGHRPAPAPITPSLDALLAGGVDSQWIGVGCGAEGLHRSGEAPLLRDAHGRPRGLRPGPERDRPGR